MARLLAAVALLAPATGFVAPAAPASSSALRADASGMDGIQAPTGFFDPLGLSKSASDETLAWYRAAEIKHGRVAMAAFLGCVVNGLGLEFPGAIDVNGDTFASMGSTKLPLETWDSIPASGRIQLITAIGGMEWVFEAQQPHYLRGGTPGAIRLTPGTAPWHASGYDPMGKYDAETRQKKRNMELANGRLAMLGMAAFVAAEKIPGSVPILAKLGFAGDYVRTRRPFHIDLYAIDASARWRLKSARWTSTPSTRRPRASLVNTRRPRGFPPNFPAQNMPWPPGAPMFPPRPGGFPGAPYGQPTAPAPAPEPSRKRSRSRERSRRRRRRGD